MDQNPHILCGMDCETLRKGKHVDQVRQNRCAAIDRARCAQGIWAPNEWGADQC